MAIRVSEMTLLSAPAEDDLIMIIDADNTSISMRTTVGRLRQALLKTSTTKTGAGGVTPIAIGANVIQNSVEVYADGSRLTAGTDYTVTRSIPVSGNYDQITPSFSDAIPNGAFLEIVYVTA